MMKAKPVHEGTNIVKENETEAKVAIFAYNGFFCHKTK